MDTHNKFLVGWTPGNGVDGGAVRIGLMRGLLSPDDAVLLAAWLVAIADVHAQRKFSDVLDDVLTA